MIDSLVIECWNDLEQVGIRSLTGEACRYSMRVLCDVNEDGRQLLVEYLGMPDATQFAARWNSMVNGKASIGSIMLHRNSLREVAEFALMRMEVLAVVRTHDGVRGIFEARLLERYRAMVATANAAKGSAPGEGYVIVDKYVSNAPAVGSRNIHMATDRTL